MNPRHPPCKRGRRPPVGSKGGFTLVELMVAAVAGTVLALTAGSLLFLCNKTLARTIGQQEVQRDATFAMDMLSRTVQSSRGREISVSANQILFTTNHVRARPVRFSVDGQNNLVYDPDTTTAGNEIRVVNRRVAAFTATVASNRMWIALGVSEAGKSLYLTNCLTFRNGT